jgi:small subunit ribosomal protein S20
MPNIKSAKKRVLVAETKTMQNKMLKSNMNTMIKKANAAIDSDSADKAEAVKVAIKTVDKCVAKGVISKNAAARKKSHLAKAAK